MPRCLVALILFASPASAAEPTVAELVKQLESGTPGERVIAAEKLGDRGPAAAEQSIPALVKIVRTTRPPKPLSIHKRWSLDVPPERRVPGFLFTAALDALIQIGPKAVPALADLLSHESDETREYVVEALRAMKVDAAPAVPALAKLLTAKDYATRILVSNALETIGPGAVPAVPALIDHILSDETKAGDNAGWSTADHLYSPPRVYPARALWSIGAKAEPEVTKRLIPALFEELKSRELVFGGTAAEVLEALGEMRASTVPDLVAYAKSPRKGGASGVGRALRKMGPAGRKVFADLLDGPDEGVWAEMAGSFKTAHWERDPPDDVLPYVPGLLKGLRAKDVETRLGVVGVLMLLRSDAPKDVVDAMGAVIRDPEVLKRNGDDDRLGLAMLALDFAALHGEPGVTVLATLAQSGKEFTRSFSIIYLAELGPKAKAALPVILKIVASDDMDIAVLAAGAAATVSRDEADIAVLFGKRFLHNADPEVRKSALSMIVSVGPLAAKYGKELIPFLTDTDIEIGHAAARAIEAIGPEAKEAAKALAMQNLLPKDKGGFDFYFGYPPGTLAAAVEELPTTNRPERLLYVIAAHGHDAKDAIPLVKKRLTDPNLAVRTAAARALECIDPTHKQPPPDPKLHADPDPVVRLNAAFDAAKAANDFTAFAPYLKRVATRAHRAQWGRHLSQTACGHFATLPSNLPELVPVFARVLNEQAPEGSLAIAGLTGYGPAARAAVPGALSYLREILIPPRCPQPWDTTGQVAFVCDFFGAVGPDARAALPELRRLAKGESKVSTAARDAIRKIEEKGPPVRKP